VGAVGKVGENPLSFISRARDRFREMALAMLMVMAEVAEIMERERSPTSSTTSTRPLGLFNEINDSHFRF
jgi:hypothetical protein